MPPTLLGRCLAKSRDRHPSRPATQQQTPSCMQSTVPPFLPTFHPHGTCNLAASARSNSLLCCCRCTSPLLQFIIAACYRTNHAHTHTRNYSHLARWLWAESRHPTSICRAVCIDRQADSQPSPPARACPCRSAVGAYREIVVIASMHTAQFECTPLDVGLRLRRSRLR